MQDHLPTSIVARPPFLAGLEHLDERYLKAVGYATKAKRTRTPKMVLIADVVSDDERAVGEAASEIVRIANLRHGEGFIAVSAEARKKFWLDRARTAAIAKHTNAFKVNEDVVIPLPRMGDYCDGIERINIELSLGNKIKLLDALEEFFAGELPLTTGRRESQLRSCWSVAQQARELLVATQRWQGLLDDLDARERFFPDTRTSSAAATFGSTSERLLDLQNRTLRASWKLEVREPLRQIFSGRTFLPPLDHAMPSISAY